MCLCIPGQLLTTDHKRMNVDFLFRLFGVYGDVLRVKILYNKPDTALIMFSNPLGAYAFTHC